VSKTVRLGLNGLGRIGRAVFRIAEARPEVEVVAINELNPDNRNLAYLLKNDSTYGRLNKSVVADTESIAVDERRIPVYHERNIDKVRWADAGVELIVDSSGSADNLIQVRHVHKSVRNVIVTNAPDVDDVTAAVFGCNAESVDPRAHRIISSSICDAVAFTPIAKELHERLGIAHGHLTTLHPWLATQNLLDNPFGRWHDPGEFFSNYVLGRAAPGNLLPKTTTAISASMKVIPDIAKTVACFSFRVPTNIVTTAVFVFVADRKTTAEEIQSIFTAYERTQTHKIIRNNFEPLISSDFTGEEYSAILDHRWTSVVGGNHVRVSYWYDNEWGYSSRVVDLVEHLAAIHRGSKS
jgi:glyceraldehyde 3-phosphate dehydrogenase